MPEAWLSGPVAGVPASLMPAAHSLLDALAEMEGAASDLSSEELWHRPGGAAVASVGFHLRHVAGSIDRLLTYARGEALTDAQRAAIAAEGDPGEPPSEAGELIEQVRSAVNYALDTFRSTSEADLGLPRKVGRAGLPSSVHGLLYHAAEHTRRHSGQVVTTARVVRALKA